MRRITIPLVVLTGYAVVAFFAFGAAVVETIMLYPNIFRDVPESLAETQHFMSAVAVGDVMRPLGGVLTLCALLAAIASVRYRVGVRSTVLSLISLVSGQFLLSVLYLWPRATILFDDRDKHTLAEIERAATEFQIGEGVRIAAAALTALFAVAAALACYRRRVLATFGTLTEGG
ncbi:hypothetical protein DFR70_107300 [Nocardia tenerifensis]|uniref:DUF1772 domain-containing protein n=1 Tax=Nocardia tenerifensis TaxID=228006 RepID=A0A318K336_9NOCA|nr:hypothetical protein [Nocardia tenerifensis]PXX62432.1 hypothetical protein DFR70_107300 [Nocardia tenerifensis]